MSESRRLWKMRKALHSKPCEVVRLLLQAFAFVFGVLAREKVAPGQSFWLVATLAVVGLAIIMLALALFFRERYVIQYTLNPETGVLYDAEAGFPNVSLRVDTLNTILAWVLKMQKELGPGGPERVLYEAGVDVGQDFARKLREDMKRKGSVRDDIADGCKFLRRILEYDSSSGMGRFSLESCSTQPRVELRINVLNAFTGHTLGGCHFLRGYIRGTCEEAFNKASLDVSEVSCVGRRTASDGICRFQISESARPSKAGEL